MLLWETKNNGNFRVVRLTRRFAFKTPRILEFNGLKAEWKQYADSGEVDQCSGMKAISIPAIPIR